MRRLSRLFLASLSLLFLCEAAHAACGSTKTTLENFTADGYQPYFYADVIQVDEQEGKKPINFDGKDMSTLKALETFFEQARWARELGDRRIQQGLLNAEDKTTYVMEVHKQAHDFLVAHGAKAIVMGVFGTPDGSKGAIGVMDYAYPQDTDALVTAETICWGEVTNIGKWPNFKRPVAMKILGAPTKSTCPPNPRAACGTVPEMLGAGRDVGEGDEPYMSMLSGDGNPIIYTKSKNGFVGRQLFLLPGGQMIENLRLARYWE